MTKTLPRRVANWWFDASLMVTMSKEPGCFSTETMVPTRPVLRPLVIVQVLPTSNFWKLTILPVARSSFTVSWTARDGSG